MAVQSAYAQRVGVVSAVSPGAIGVAPGVVPRPLTVGQEVMLNEQIKTDGTGQAQILLVDGSALTVGPNSLMVVDELVYDPRVGTGQLAADLTRGVFRFTGGNLYKREEGPAGVLQNVTREVESTLPGAPTQSLVSDQEIFFGQRITTDTTGQAQLRFNDGSTKAIEPNSDTVIGDEPSPVTIKTPSATINIRG